MRVTFTEARRLHCLSYPGAHELPAPPKYVRLLSGPACLDLTVDDRPSLCGCCISDRGPSCRRRRVADGVEEMAARLYWAVEQLNGSETHVPTQTTGKQVPQRSD
jgi:hypothetical protein